jgi:hypothetical protein
MRLRIHPVLRAVSCLTVFIFLFLLPHLLLSQEKSEPEIDKSPPKGMTAEEVVRRFTAKEKEWKQVREQYAFQQSIKVEQMNGNEVVGDYRQVAEISYQGGKPVKHVLLGPQPSLQMTPEDFQDLESRATFTISTDELPEYNVTYVGQQKVDELQCYVFDVAPKQMEKDRRYFQGRIWIDDQDFQIVKNSGKSVPDIKVMKKKRLQENLFPQFTTWRQQVDGKYWFPTFSSADDTLHFNLGDVRLKEVVKFTNYKKAGSGS